MKSRLGCRSQTFAMVAGLVLAASNSLALGAEPKPGASMTVSVPGRGGRLTMKFHYCPPGKIRPGRPQPAEPGGDAKGADDPLAAALDETVPSFFMSETEVTIPQFRALLGGERLAEIAKRLRNPTLANFLKKLIASGADYPVYIASVEDAIDFSEALRAAYTPAGGNDAGGIVAYQFRIPTHTEWQYACRAVTDVASQRKRPHFHGWPDDIDVLDRNTRADCEEVWKKLGREGLGDFRGTQEQVVFMLENSEKDPEVPLKILSGFLKAGIGTSRDYSEGKNGKLSAAASTTKANAWGLYDMHENVREWVVTTNAERAAELLRGLSNPSYRSANDRQQKAFLLAGGSYNEWMKQNGWKAFTIWGGKPADSKGVPSSFSFDEAHANSEEFEPGFRVMMHRSLAETWLLAVRQDAVLSKSAGPETLSRLKAKRAAAIEVANSSQARQVEARVAFYEGLAHYRMGRPGDSAASIRAARKALPASSKNRSASSRLANALGSGLAASAEPAPAAKPVAEDELYLDTLASLIEQEQ